MPKVCRKCQKLDGEVHFEKHRAVCHACRGKDRRTKDTEPAAPPSPLEEAYKTRREREERTKSKAQVNALLDENTHLKRQIGELVKMQRPFDIIAYKQAREKRSDATAVIVASDWHVEEEVDPIKVHGLNEYNLDVAKARAEKFAQNALRLTNIMARDTKITTMYAAWLGDFFSNWIHDELLASTLLAPGDAAQFTKTIICSCIDFWLKESSYLIAGPMIPGNHGRLTDKIHFSDPVGTSLESFMYHSIVDRYYNNPRVKLHVSPAAMHYERFYETFNMRLIHGYEVKYGGGVGGLTIPLRKAVSQWDKSVRADLTVLGHFHQLFDGGDFFVNGSLIGYNTYAEAIKASFEEPRQGFFLVHARKGGQKSIVAPIWLDDAHKLPRGALPVAA